MKSFALPWLAALFASAALAQSTPSIDPPMSKAEADRLLHSVDTVMGFVATDTALPPVAHVKRRLVTRDQVNRYLTTSFAEDESAKRLQRSEIVLKKFGLLSQDFDLRPFLLKLLTEQVAGYYDDKTKTVNLLDWIPPAAQQPVLAHELTHAVQDRKVNLEQWSKTGLTGVAKDLGEDNVRIRSDEQETAREAVTEGQAMLVFVDYAARHKDDAKPGDTQADTQTDTQTDIQTDIQTGSQDVLSRAPLLLQKSLEFPYLAGLVFERAVRESKGNQAAFAGVLDQPPASSYEIMNPTAYLAHAAVPVLRLPDVHTMLDRDWEPYDVGVMGELDVDIMATLFGSPEIAGQLDPAWAGGIYYAAQRRAATAAERQTSGSIGVFYYSQWTTPAAAQAFAHLYAQSLGHKVSGLKELAKEEKSGEQVFTSRDGDILLATDGSTLFLAEGFPLATARTLHVATAAVQGNGRMQLAGLAPTHELALHALPAGLPLYFPLHTAPRR